MALDLPSGRPESGPARDKLPGSLSPFTLRPNAASRGAWQQYQRNQIETASPTRLIILLYDGAIRFCRLARDGMLLRDLETQNSNLIKAQRIVSELLSSLNHAAGGDIALNLARIYTHLFEELVKANLYDDTAALAHSIAMLTDMRESWVEIDRVAGGEPREPELALRAEEAPMPYAVRSEQASADPGRERALAKTARLLAGSSTTERHGSPSRLGDRFA